MMPQIPVPAGSRFRAIAAATVLLSGCAHGPDFVRPATPEGAVFASGVNSIQTSEAQIQLGDRQTISMTTATPNAWWQQLGSPELNRLIETAMRKNPDIAAAKATLRQSQELYAARSGATRLPQLNVSGSAQEQRFNPGSLGMPGEAREFGLFNANLGVRYNFDLNGGNRRTLEGLAARADYRRFELEGAQLTIAANIALTAIARARIAETIAIMEEVQAARRAQLRIAEGQLRLGSISADQLANVRAEVARAEAELPLLHQQWLETGNLLSVLIGSPPGSVDIPEFRLSDFTLPTDLPLVVPSQLVRQRPDILASEALMRAANADYGASVARLYPQINLSASLGTQSSVLDGLFGPGTAIWNLLGQITQPLFNPGLKAEKRASLAAFDASAANYQKTVLGALREVADTLNALQNDASRLTDLALADADARSLLNSTQQQLGLGAASQLQLEIARQRYGRSRLDLVAAQAARLSDTVSLFHSVSGALNQV